MTAVFITLESITTSQGQTWPSNGTYQVTAGIFAYCCDVGGHSRITLPDSYQSYIQLAVNSSSQRAQMAILQMDQRTVESFPLGSSPEFGHAMSNGVIFANRIQFNSPISAPGSSFLSLTLSNLGGWVRLDGEIHIPCPPGRTDCPTDYSYSNVVAVLLSRQPVIEVLRSNGDVLQFRFKGEPGYDYFVQASSALPTSHWISLTNFRAKLQPIEPLVSDAFNQSPARFYRIRKQDCQCD